MCLLNRLPAELVSSILSAWLMVVDVAHVDSAMCSAELRDEFLESAYKSGTVLRYPTSAKIWDSFCGPMNDWISSKDVPVVGLFATDFFFCPEKRRKYLEQQGHGIQWVEYGYQFSYFYDNNCHMQSITDIAQYCSKLVRLKVTDHVNEEGLMQIIRSCPLLEELDSFGSCSTDVVLELSKRYSALKKVRLNCFQVDEDALVQLVHNNRGLLCFDVHRTAATETLVRELAVTCTGLVELTLGCTKVTHASICFLLKSCRSLTSLALDSITYGSNVERTVMPVFPLMRSISLSEIRGPGSIPQLGDLLRACPNLTSLHIWECPAVPADAMLPIAVRFPSLQDIALFDCGIPVNEQLLLDISEHYPQLRKLEIPFSEDVTNAGLIAVARYCPLLEELDVTRCADVTNDSLIALAEHCLGLRHLMLAECSQITDAGVAAVMKSCSRLVKLCVEDCSELTKRMERKINKRYPNSL
jgi:hypothetical protein